MCRCCEAGGALWCICHRVWSWSRRVCAPPQGIWFHLPACALAAICALHVDLKYGRSRAVLHWRMWWVYWHTFAIKSNASFNAGLLCFLHTSHQHAVHTFASKPHHILQSRTALLLTYTYFSRHVFVWQLALGLLFLLDFVVIGFGTLNLSI